MLTLENKPRPSVKNNTEFTFPVNKEGGKENMLMKLCR
jgi:hypothetical protein